MAAELAADGADVVILGRRPEPLRAAAAQINADIGAVRVRAVPADLAQVEQVRAAAADITDGERHRRRAGQQRRRQRRPRPTAGPDRGR
nr:SDR family NAD(P)-dependent oxidoreductase [Salinispora arenicola]